MVELIQYTLRALVALAIILVVLFLFGISPYQVGEAIGNTFGMIGDFFRGVQRGN